LDQYALVVVYGLEGCGARAVARQKVQYVKKQTTTNWLKRSRECVVCYL